MNIPAALFFFPIRCSLCWMYSIDGLNFGLVMIYLLPVADSGIEKMCCVSFRECIWLLEKSGLLIQSRFSFIFHVRQVFDINYMRRCRGMYGMTVVDLLESINLCRQCCNTATAN